MAAAAGGGKLSAGGRDIVFCGGGGAYVRSVQVSCCHNGFGVGGADTAWPFGH